jgi:small nuclear ribonucleoprotein
MITEVLERSVGKVVLVRLRGGTSLRGKLEGFDQHMNLVLVDVEDVSVSDDVKGLGTIILRGDNVVMVSPPPR